MIKLHHLNNSRSTRIIWLLEELKLHYPLDYELVSYERQDSKLAPDTLKRIHPLGKAPILQDSNFPASQANDTNDANNSGNLIANHTQALTIAESGAIIEHLLNAYDTDNHFSPKMGSTEWQDYIFWLHFAEGSAMTPLLFSLIFAEIPVRSPAIIRPIAKAISKNVTKSFVQPNLDRHNQLIEQTLSQRPWFAGERLTGADIQMSFVIEGICVRCDMSKYPNTKAWLKGVRARPAYQTALKKGGDLILG